MKVGMVHWSGQIRVLLRFIVSMWSKPDSTLECIQKCNQECIWPSPTLDMMNTTRNITEGEHNNPLNISCGKHPLSPLYKMYSNSCIFPVQMLSNGQLCWITSWSLSRWFSVARIHFIWRDVGRSGKPLTSFVVIKGNLLPMKYAWI